MRKLSGGSNGVGDGVKPFHLISGKHNKGLEMR